LIPRPALVFLLATLALCGPALGGEPMGEEEVVRMFVAGRSNSEIKAEIERRDAGFDLSPEMLEELRRVRLPEELIQAMVDRQEETTPAEAPVREETAVEPAPSLRLRFDLDGDGDGGQVSLATHIDPQFAAEWELGNAPEDRVFADLALFVACYTAEHVPDQWRIKSPLGRDFETIRRHKILEFISADVRETAGPIPKRIKLPVPAEIDLALAPGEFHEIVFGLAVHVGGRYRVATLDRWDDVIVEQETVELPARAQGRSFRTFKVGFVRDGDDEASDESSDR
jgi:hypothetical protein